MSSMKNRGHVWNDKWIIDNFSNYEKLDDMREDYNRIFETDYSWSGFQRHVREKIGLTNNYSDEEIAWFAKYYPNNGVLKTMGAFEELFGRKVTRQAVIMLAFNRNIQVKDDICKANKGRAVRKEGSKRALRNTYDLRNDGTHYRMKDENGRWRSASRVIWEKYNGPLPDNHVVIFLDRNPRNLIPDNLVAIPKTYLSMLNGNKFKLSTPETTLAAIEWCKLNEAIMLHTKEE